MTKITLHLDKRELQGRKVKQLRRQGIIPANIFGKNIDSASVQLKDKDFQKTFEEAGETSIIYATIADEKKERPLLVSAAQIHPVTGSILHVDFHQVDLTEKVTAAVPLVFVDVAPAVDEKGAVLVQMTDEIEVEALPADLPSQIEVSLSSLKEFGDSLHIKDIKIDVSKLEIKNDLEEIVAQVQEPKEEEVAEAPQEGEAGAEAAPEAPASEEKSE